MRFEYDRAVDAACMSFAKKPAATLATTKELPGSHGVMADYDYEGNLIGLDMEGIYQEARRNLREEAEDGCGYDDCEFYRVNMEIVVAIEQGRRRLYAR